MLKNYVVSALRNLRRHPAYAGLNVAGLAVGMACCLLILLFVAHEWTYDRSFTHADRLVRGWAETRLGDAPAYDSNTAAAFGPFVQAQFGEVEAFTRVQGMGTVLVRQGGTIAYEQAWRFADPAFLNLFDVAVLEGHAATALDAPNSVVLTPALAQRYFGDTSPVGHTLEVEFWSGLFDLTVTGVIAPPPSNASVRYEALVSFATNVQQQLAAFGQDIETEWNSLNPDTFFLLRPDADWQALEAKLTTAVTEHIKASSDSDDDPWFTYYLQPLTDVHLNRLGLPLAAAGDVRYVYLFSLIALLILGIACINYMNLATARAVKRAKEVGVRKVLGAQRSQLAGQFLAEATLLSALAFALALALVEVTLPLFNHVMDQALGTPTRDLRMLAGLLGAALLTGLLAGSYPAFVLSSFRPIATLRGRFVAGRKGVLLRKGLVVAQFACGVALIIVTLGVASQLRYMSEKKLGFDQEQVLSVPLRGTDLRSRHGVLKQELAQVPGVRAATVGHGLPGQNPTGNGVGLASSDEHPPIRHVIAVDADYDEVLGVRLVAGRWFDAALPTDSSAYVVNEAAVRDLGLADPLGVEINRNGAVGPIIGVVADFHYLSLHAAIEPLYLYHNRQGWDHRAVALRLDAGRTAEAMDGLRAAWARLVPDRPFTYTFLDDTLDQLYASEQRLGTLFGGFAGLGLFVACLGLFGLAAFTAEQRTKEVGIRKVLGADVSGLVALLSKDFLRLVLISLVVAAPVAYVVLQRWLEDFAYRITLGPTVFLVAGALALLIAFLTVSLQALRAALADPVNALRYE